MKKPMVRVSKYVYNLIHFDYKRPTKTHRQASSSVIILYLSPHDRDNAFLWHVSISSENDLQLFL